MKRIVTQMRRTLSLVLAAMMVLTAVPQSVDTVYGAEISTLEEPSIEFAAEDIQAPVEENVEIVDETVSAEDEGDEDIDENDALITEDEFIEVEESEEELVMDSEYRLPKPLTDSIFPTSLKQNNIRAEIRLNKEALDNVELNENEDIYLIARIASDVPLYANDEKSEDGKYWMWDGRLIRSKETKSPESIDVDYSIWSRGYFESMFKEPITEGTKVTIAYQYQIIEDHDGKRGDHGINFTVDKGIEYSSRESREVTVTPNYLYVYKNGGTWKDGYEGADPRAFALVEHVENDRINGYSFNKLPDGYDTIEDLLVKEGSRAEIRYTMNENINVEPSQYGPNYGEYDGKNRIYLSQEYCVDGNGNWYVTPKWYEQKIIKIVPGEGARFKFGEPNESAYTKDFYFDGKKMYPVNADELAEFSVLAKNDWMCNDANFYIEGPSGKESWWYCVCSEDGVISNRFEEFRFERAYYDKYADLIADGKLHITPLWKTPVPGPESVREYKFLNISNEKTDVEALLDDARVESFVNNELEVGEKLVFIMATPTTGAEGSGILADSSKTINAGPMGVRSPYVIVGSKTEDGVVFNKNSRGKYYINITNTYENGVIFESPYNSNGKILPTYGFAVVKWDSEYSDYVDIKHGTFAAPGAQDRSGWIKVPATTGYKVLVEEYEGEYEETAIFPVTVKSGNAAVTRKTSSGIPLEWNYDSKSNKDLQFTVNNYTGSGYKTLMPNPDEVYYSIGESSEQIKINRDANNIYTIPKDAITDTVHIYTYKYALVSIRSAYKDEELNVQVKSSFDSKFYSDGELHMVGTSQSDEVAYRFLNANNAAAAKDVEVFAVKPDTISVGSPVRDASIITEAIKGLNPSDYMKLTVSEKDGEYTFKVPVDVPNSWKKRFNIYVLYGTKRSTLRIFKNDTESNVSVKYGSKSQKLTMDGAVQPYMCTSDVGEVATVTVSPKENCSILWVKVADNATSQSAVDWDKIAPVKIDTAKGGTFDVKLSSDSIIRVQSTRNIVITSVNGLSGQAVPYSVKNGYSVDKGLTYTISAKFGTEVLNTGIEGFKWTDISDPKGVVTPDVNFAYNGKFTVNTSETIKPGLYVISLKNARTKDDNKEYSVTLNILPAIDKVSMKAVKNGEILNQVADTEVSYPLTVSNANATNTLELRYADNSLVGADVANISEDMKTLTVKTSTTPDAAEFDGKEIRIVNTRGNVILYTFKLKAIKPAQYNAPKLSVTSDHMGYSIVVTNDQKMQPVLNGCYAYSTKVTYVLDGVETIKYAPLKVVKFESGKPEKTTGTIRVDVLDESANKKVKSKIEVSLVKLDRVISDETYTCQEVETYVTQNGKAASTTSETLFRAYETKLSLTRKQSTVYTGQSGVVVAVPKFNKITSYKSLQSVKVTDKNGAEVLDGTVSAVIDSETNNILVTVGSAAVEGKYYVVAEALAEPGIIPASAKSDFTVKTGTNNYAVKVPTTRLYKPAKNKATLKATVVYPSGVKGKVTWSIIPVDENGTYSEQTKAVIDEKLIKMNNGTVTVDKNYSQPAEGYDYIKIKVEGPNYKNEIISAESDVIKIDADVLQFLAPVVSGNGISAGEALHVGTEGYKVVIKNKSGEEIDPSLYTLKISTPKAFRLETDGTFTAAAVAKNVKITATANDGSKFSTQTLVNIVNKVVVDSDAFGIKICGTKPSDYLLTGSELKLTDVYTPADYISIEPAINGFTGNDIKSYSIKVDVKNADKLTVAGKTYYRFKADGTSFKPVSVVVTDTSVKANRNDIRLSKTFTIESSYTIKTAKITAKQNTTKKLYEGTYAGQQTVRVDIKDASNIFADSAVKLAVMNNDPKNDNLYGLIEDSSKEVSVLSDSTGKYAEIKFKPGATLTKGKYNLILVAKSGLEDKSAYAQLTLNVEKQSPAIGKYAPVSKVTLTYDGTGVLYPEAELLATYNPARGEDVTTHPAVTEYIGLMDDTVNGRTNGFTDYFVLSGNSLKVKEVEGVPAWKVIIPKTALTGYIKYTAKYGTNVDGTYAVDPGMTDVKYAKITVTLAKTDAFYTHENAINMIDAYFKTFEVSEKAYMSGNMKTIEAEIKKAITTSLGDSAKKYDIKYDTSRDSFNTHFTEIIKEPTALQQGELRSYFYIKGTADSNYKDYRTIEDGQGLIVNVSKIKN